MFLGLRLHATTYGIEREGCVEGVLVTRGENWNSLGLHEAVEVRIAIITGSADAIVDARDHSCRLHRQVPESTLAVVPGLGHMSHYSARGQIGRAVDVLMALTRMGPVSLS
jgi:pimeloyl-ACP methyl ester carboxylesterase